MITQLAITKHVGLAEQQFLASHYPINNTAEWLLDLQNNHLMLINKTQNLTWGIDLTTGNYRHRQQFHSKEPLLKAIKINGKLPNRVFDMTAGVLKDTFLMHSRGIEVSCVERNPLLYTLQQHAIAHAGVDINLYFGNAVDYLANIECDLIYIDPMYPLSKKSALVKKDMQILHNIVGQDNDADLLLLAAFNHPARIVVKRPVGAPFLAEQKANFSSQLGNTRYDIYLPRN